MGEEANSWIRRTKFSHTVCHRLDSSRLASVQFSIRPERISGLKSRPAATSSSEKSTTIYNKQRSLSPLPETRLNDVFKEARSERKRFMTPLPRRREQANGAMGKFVNRDFQVVKASNSKSMADTSPLRHLASLKGNDKLKNRKESSWAKYFDHGGGRVNAVETSDEWTVDLSKLFLGLKFAHGAHSRLYHGLYNDEPVAVKIIRVPDDDENGALGARLEKQYNREVTHLSRLHYHNVIKVTNPFLFHSVILLFVMYIYFMAGLVLCLVQFLCWLQICHSFLVFLFHGLILESWSKLSFL